MRQVNFDVAPWSHVSVMNGVNSFALRFPWAQILAVDADDLLKHPWEQMQKVQK